MRANNANKRLGQYFLVNLSVLRKIVASLEVAPGDTVIEIGPGHGELTGELLALRFELLGKDVENARIVVIEKDQRLAEELRQRFATEPRIEIVTGDALKVLPSIVTHLFPNPSSPKSYNLKASAEGGSASGGQGYRLAGNIPYYITGHLLRIISELEHKPKQCVFTLQKEVAERICAKPPRANRLSVSVQYWAEPKIIAVVPREDFKPMPKVDSAILVCHSRVGGNPETHREAVDSRLRGNDTIDRESYYRAVRVLFAQPRKTVLNNLVESMKYKGESMEGDIGTSGKKIGAMRILKQAGIDPKARPQNLSVEQIIALSKTGKGLNQSV